jgi:hypothetical protein
VAHVSPPISAILLDAGGVLIFPQPDLLRPALLAAGLSPDTASFEQAHYRAMVIQDLAGTPPVAGTWWREYLAGYLAACGVAEERCRDLAAQVAAATTGGAWTHVGPQVMEGLQALAALGLPMGVVSNSDGSVQAELRAGRAGCAGPPAAGDSGGRGGRLRRGRGGQAGSGHLRHRA